MSSASIMYPVATNTMIKVSGIVLVSSNEATGN